MAVGGGGGEGEEVANQVLIAPVLLRRLITVTSVAPLTLTCRSLRIDKQINSNGGL